MPVYAIGSRSVEFRGASHFIAPDATVVGSVVLEADVSVWFQVVIRAENDQVTLGEGSNVQDGSVLHVDPGYPLKLGRRVTIGHKVMLHGCSVGDGSLIGINSVIMNGATIGSGTLIGANTLVPEGKDIPDRSLVVGSPGRVVRQLTDEEVQYVLGNAAHYVEKLKRYRSSLEPQV